MNVPHVFPFISAVEGGEEVVPLITIVDKDQWKSLMIEGHAEMDGEQEGGLDLLWNMLIGKKMRWITGEYC